MSPPPPQPTAPSRSDPTLGVVALVLGILGLTALPVIGSILAIVFGSQARNEAEAEPQRYRDELGRIGRILGWVGIALALAGVLIAAAMVVLWVGL